MHEVLVNRLGGLSLPRKNVVRITDRPDMTLDVYRGRKTTKQQQQQLKGSLRKFCFKHMKNCVHLSSRGIYRIRPNKGTFPYKRTV